MDLLGLSLEDLFNFCSRELSLKTVFMLADQMVSWTKMSADGKHGGNKSSWEFILGSNIKSNSYVSSASLNTNVSQREPTRLLLIRFLRQILNNSVVCSGF
ncbi:hypothetical protein L1987_20335 [Smallanthus sonchifolius]|uniref:Uncharacterized protein n=1 Tax=Smallanthus sonchifolius TaxID=185202 RepID=A0ACB9IR52_9ASTR|nr:hypothetical protein L1987_20335 [Smallanthus sonchifolius]